MPFIWESIESTICDRDEEYPTNIYRAKVPGGWFVLIEGQPAFFYPDPNHSWDGNTLK